MKSENGNHQMDEHDPDAQDQMVSHIKAKQAHKIHARHTKDQSVWLGLGMMGAVGWSVAIPMLLGIAIGIWIDARWPSSFSWTLLLLILGLLVGCVNAWLWVIREQRNIQKNKDAHDHD